MDISQTKSRPVNFSFAQGIGDFSSEQLNKMDISDLMTLVMTRMLDAKEVQFKQKLEQADARTKKLEGFGDQMKALARLNAEFGAEDKDDTKLRDSKGGKDKVSSDQWDESSIDNTLANSSSASSSSKSTSSSKYKAIDNLTTDEKAAVFDRAANNLQESITVEERDYLYGGGGNGTGDPVLDKSIQTKLEKAWHDTGYDVPANTDSNRGAIWDRGSKVIDKNLDWNAGFSETKSHLGERMERALTAHYKSDVKAAETTAAGDKTFDVDLTSTWRADLTDEGQQLMGQVDTFCQSGLANGTLTDADAANIMSGDFKKSDLDALQVAIKNEQEKIGSMNTRDQIDIQKITGQIDQLNNLISTLAKKFNEASTGVINKL
jgi:hypothetical protein